MIPVKREITKEEYELSKTKGPYFLIPDYIKWGYGAYGAITKEEDGKYFLMYDRGETCD